MTPSPSMDEAQEQLRKEIIAAMWRYGLESDLSFIEIIQAAHQAVEQLTQTAIRANNDSEDL